jgi:stage IV sporulation protein FB
MIQLSYKLATIMGIPIRAHLTLVILLPFGAMQFIPFFGGNFFWALLCAIGIFACIALHELGHSWVAIRKGCRVREIMLMPIGGVAKMESIPSRPMDELLMAAAGPATSAVLALLCHIIAGLFFDASLFSLAEVFYILSIINLFLCVFNLLPSFPMDGGRIFRAFMTPRLGKLKATELAARIGRTIAVIGGFYGLFSWQPMLIIIAIYIHHAAGAEYRAMLAQQMQQNFFGTQEKEGLEADIHVSPPPYARSAQSSWKKKASEFFDRWK